MPEMDGIETLQNMRLLADNLNREIPVIMLTANAIVGAKEEYMEAGFTDYLTKPIRETELLEMLLKYLPGELVREKDGQETGVQETDGQVMGTQKIEEQKKEATENKNDSEQPGMAAYTDEAETDPMHQLEKLEGLDVKTGLIYCMNEEDFYIEMLQEYMKADKASGMRQFFAAGDWDNYRITVHALKSTSLTIGAVHLSEEAKALEMAAKEGDVEFIRSHHDDTLEEYSRLKDRLQEIVDMM